MPPENTTPTPENKAAEPLVLTKEEQAAVSSDMYAVFDAQTQRDQEHPELDGMTYVQYYDSNRKKDLSYIPKKKNKQDVRISSGVTREKDTTLLSTMLGMDFGASITAFDKDDVMVAELGTNMGDLVKKSREIEEWSRKRPLVYRELIAQGDVFVQELKVEEFRDMPLERITWDPADGEAISKFSYAHALKKVFSGCANRMINGKKVYLGNIREPFIKEQQTVAVLNVYPRSIMQGRYGTFARWKNVSSTIEMTQAFSIDGNTYKSWNLMPLAEGQVAELMVYRPKINRFQIYLNGTPMLPHNFPLSAISPTGEVPIAQGKYEGIPDFAYSKSQPSKTKVDQEVLDETTKLMIESMRQGAKPSMGTKGKGVTGRNIYIAGKVTPDVQEGEYFPLLPAEARGINQGAFSFYQLIKDGIAEKSVNKAYEGDSEDIDTLGQAQMDKEQQMLKLGLALDSVIQLEKDLTWLRLFNILENWTLPQGVPATVDETRTSLTEYYKKFTVETALANGEGGIKQFRFSDDGFPDEDDQVEEEKELSDMYGKPFRIVYMDPEQLRAIKYVWYIVITATPKNGDKLSQLMFFDAVDRAVALFGPDALNLEYVKQQFAINMKLDYQKFFKPMDLMAMLRQGLTDPTMENAAGLPQGGAKPAGGRPQPRQRVQPVAR